MVFHFLFFFDFVTLKAVHSIAEPDKEDHHRKGSLLASKTNCGKIKVLWGGDTTVFSFLFLFLLNLRKLHDLYQMPSGIQYYNNKYLCIAS